MKLHDIRGKKLNVQDLEKAIRKFFKSNTGKVYSSRQVLNKLKVANNKNQIKAALDRMVKSKELTITTKDQYQLVRKVKTRNEPSKNKNQILGVVDMTRLGSAFIISKTSDIDVFVSSKNVGIARNGDTVLVEIIKKTRGRRPEGKVVEIIKRNKEDNTFEILISKGISTNSKDMINLSLEERIFYIRKSIFEILNKFRPDYVTIESLAYRINSNNGRILAGIFFNLLTLFTELNLRYFVINPKTLKKFACGNGNGSKEDLKNAINGDIIVKLSELSHLKDTSKKFEDIVDSFWLSLFKFEEIKALN